MELIPVILISGFFALIALFISLGLYILFSLGLYVMASNKGIDIAWLAFIPVAQSYIFGMIIEDMYIGDYKVPELPIVMVTAVLAPMFLGWIPIIGWVISLAALIINIYGIYLVYKMYGESPFLKTVLSVILPFLPPIFIFLLRNETPMFDDQQF